MDLYVTRSGSAFPYTGYVYKHTPGATSMTALTLPTEAVAGPRRPAMAFYRGRAHIVGPWSVNLCVDEEFRVSSAGIPAPPKAPTLAASGTGLTAEIIGYVTFLEMRNGKIIQESNPSKSSNTLSASNQGVAWSTLPTTSLSARVTHISGYRSMDGALPRRAWIRELGTTSVTENVPTATLANLTPLPVDTDGALDTAARGVPQPALYVTIFHERAWYVVPGKRGVYFSKLFEPESVNPASFLDTKDGEMPTGLGVCGDELIVFCAEAAYAVTGFGTSDFSMRKVSNSLGALSHWGIVNIQGTLWFPSHQGVTVYRNGQMTNLMARSYRSSWIAAYAAAPSIFEDSVGVDDRNGHYLLLTTPASGNRSKTYVGNYRAITEEGALEPWWAIDVRTRTDTWVGLIAGGTAQRRVVLGVGSSDGYVRKEDATDDDDDSDSYAKALAITHKHFFFGDQSGSMTQARTIQFIHWFGVNTSDSVTVSLYLGDDDATSAAAAQWSDSLSAVSDTAAVRQTSVRMTVKRSGKGATPKVTATSPVGFEHRGVALEYEDFGSQARPTK